MTTYKILKDFGDHKAGASVDLDDSIGKGLVATGVAQVATLDLDAAVAAAVKGFKAGAAEAMKDVIDSATKGMKESHIVVGEDRSLATGGFKSLGHFCRDLRDMGQKQMSAPMQDYINKAPTGQNTVDSVDGGILVPPEFTTNLMEVAVEESVVRQNAQLIPMSGNTMTVPTLAYDTGGTEGVGGGVTCQRIAEGEQYIPSVAKFTSVKLEPTKIVSSCRATEEMLSDSAFNMEAILYRLMGQSIAWQEDSDYLNGSGTGEPLGILQSNATIVVPEEAGPQTTDTIVYKNLVRIYSRLLPQSRKNAKWVFNPTTLPDLMSLVIGNMPVWCAGNSATNAPQGTIFGLPVLFSSQLPEIGEEGCVLLADFGQYLIGSKGGITTGSSIHLRFDYGETAYKAVLRSDGRPWLDEDWIPAPGKTSFSPFVILGEV